MAEDSTIVTEPPADPPTTIVTEPPADPPADTPPADPPPADPDDKGSDPPKPEGTTGGEPPEKYELGIEESANVNPTLVTEAEQIFREIGLTNDQAVKVGAILTRAKELDAEAWTQANDEWAQAVKDDPDMGGERYDATVARVRNVASRFGSPAFNEALEQYGFGNHPELVRFIDNIAKAIGEDRTPGKPPGALPSETESLRARYPTMFNDDGEAKK